MGERVIADTETTLYALVKPEVGASSDSWGSKLNNNINDLDALLGAITTTGSGAAYVLTTGLSLASYVSGMSFLIKASFTCNAAATINVDGLGAKNITKNGTTATVSGDIVSGTIYRIAYDGTQFQIVGPVGTGAQPLDATLTALAALSWSSGNALVQFTAADTVSLTLAPSVTTVTASGAITAGSFEFGAGTDTTITRSAAGIIAVEGVDQVNVSAAQSLTNKQITVPVSSEITGSLTSASRNKKVNCAGNVTLPSSGMADGEFILIDPAGTARTITRPGAHTMYVNNTDSATATSGAHNCVLAVFHGSSKWSLYGTA